jgi:hypothetical protein
LKFEHGAKREQNQFLSCKKSQVLQCVVQGENLLYIAGSEQTSRR